MEYDKMFQLDNVDKGYESGIEIVVRTHLTDQDPDLSVSQKKILNLKHMVWKKRNKICNVKW